MYLSKLNEFFLSKKKQHSSLTLLLSLYTLTQAKSQAFSFSLAFVQQASLRLIDSICAEKRRDKLYVTEDDNQHLNKGVARKERLISVATLPKIFQVR